MGRRLANMALIAAASFTTSAYGVSLGNLDAASTLNEPLLARIPLTSVSNVDPGRINVNLAPTAAFERAGLKRSFYLSKLNFEVVRESAGTFVEVSTDSPVKEPFLDFLIEVNWPQGRLQREYTILLDPPTFQSDTQLAGDGNGADGAAAEGAVSAGVTATPQPAESTGSGTSYGPVKPSDTLYEIASQVRPDSDISINRVMLALLRANPEAFAGNNINRLQRGAVLQVPTAQSMTALSEADATAEVQRQTAAWQSGSSSSAVAQASTPSVPESRDTGAPDSAQIAAAGTSSTSPAASGAPETSEATGTAAGTAEDANKPSEGSAGAALADANGSQSSGELRVVAPSDTQGEQAARPENAQPTASARLADVEERLTMLEETNASLSSENQDLKAQVEGLKRELADMERTLNIQLDGSGAAQLAGTTAGSSSSQGASGSSVISPMAATGGGAFSDQGSANAADLAGGISAATPQDGAAATTSGSAAGTSSGSASLVASDASKWSIIGSDFSDLANVAAAGGNATSAAIASSADSASRVAAAEDADASGQTGEATLAAISEPTNEAAQSEAEGGSAASRETVPSAGEQTASASDTAAAANASASPSVMELATQRWELIAAAGGAAVVLGLGLVSVRRRGQRTEDDAAMASEMPLEMPSAPAARPAVADETEEGDTPSVTQRPDSANKSLEQAEQYIGFGEYQQAQGLLDTALGENPDDRSIRHKLLEVLVRRGDRGGFEAEAQVLHTQIDSEQDPLWQSTVAMGREIAPDHPLFRSTQGDEAAPNSQLESPAGTAALQPEDEAVATSVAEPAATSRDDAAAHLTDSREPNAGPADSESVAGNGFASDDDDHDFVLDFTWDNAPLATPESTSEADTADLDGSDPGTTGRSEEQPLEWNDDSVGMLDFDPPEASESDSSESAPAEAEGEADAQATTENEFSDADPAVSAADYEELDEVGTKLDLARAYIDMGDEEGARGLLEEVIQEGDDGQRNEAQGLMKRAG